MGSTMDMGSTLVKQVPWEYQQKNVNCRPAALPPVKRLAQIPGFANTALVAAVAENVRYPFISIGNTGVWL